MKIAQFHTAFEAIAPASIAWKGDNIGLLIGRPERAITNVLVALDLTEAVIADAVRKRANLIITHHPAVFHPLKNITPSSSAGTLALEAIERNIAVYAAHTNLDSVRWGVNFSLASVLGLQNVRILSPIDGSLTNITVFVPAAHTDAVADAMHSAGAGMFEKYDTCSFRSDGTGTFRGNSGASPFIGTVGNVERVQEVRLEMLCAQWKVKSVLSAMLKAHPYEEVAYTVTPISNRNTEYGLGAIGELPAAMGQQAFLTMVKERLQTPAVRYSGHSRTIRRVAVCGGSGSEFIRDAAAQGADAMVTADCKYHTFQEHEQSLLLVDAGHYETEVVVLPALADVVRSILKTGRHTGKVFITKTRTNPVHIF
ncbi:MAG: Nif3-like dinuclear metal center hexameric protein [Bacteroidetes bacterium]|nr:Nif3-like dinuclear metal center hexameric protein [Bacteroidota bacterium]